jgi:hypothetical protein
MSHHGLTAYDPVKDATIHAMADVATANDTIEIATADAPVR